MSRVHELKIWPEYFESVEDGTKTFELRKNDRDFKVGDTLILKEWKFDLEKNEYGEERWSNAHYTGRKIRKKITYILQGRNYETQGSGLRKGWVILGLK